MSEGNNIAKVVVAAILIIGIGAILVGNLEVVMNSMKTATMSASFNTTIANLISYTWTAYGLIALGTLILGARYILQQVGYL